MKENMLIIRRLLLTLALVCVGYTLQAQDLIVKKSGEVLTVYNIDIAERWVYYTADTTEDAELKRIAREEVFSVKLAGGDMQMIGAAQSAQTPAPKAEEPKAEIAESAPKIITRKVADNNAALIAQYNRSHITGFEKKEPSDKQVNSGIAVIQVGSESVLSNEDLEVSTEIIVDNQQWEWITGYRIYLRNKTNRVIYVDLANTFRIANNGSSKVYFDGEQVTETKGGSTGGAINLGAITGAVGIGGTVGTIASGVNVGGQNQKSTSQTFGNQRILAIPPMGKVALPPHYRAAKKEVVEEYDSFKIDLPEAQFPLQRWHIYNFEEADSPWKNHFIVTYSHEADFKNYADIKFSFYVSQLIGHNSMDMGSYGLFLERAIGFVRGTMISHLRILEGIKEIKDVKNSYSEGGRWQRNYY